MNEVQRVIDETRAYAAELTAALGKQGYNVLVEERGPTEVSLRISHAGVATSATVRGGSPLGPSVSYEGGHPIGRDISAAWLELKRRDRAAR